MLWGAGLANQLHYMVPIVGTAITYGVICAVPGIGMTYVVDCYRPVSKETLTIITAAKNTFAFGLSFAVFPWIERDGLVKVGGSPHESLFLRFGFLRLYAHSTADLGIPDPYLGRHSPDHSSDVYIRCKG
jgi:hypothetical protein